MTDWKMKSASIKHVASPSSNDYLLENPKRNIKKKSLLHQEEQILPPTKK